MLFPTNSLFTQSECAIVEYIMSLLQGIRLLVLHYCTSIATRVEYYILNVME